MSQKIKNIIGIIISVSILLVTLYLAYMLGNSVVQGYIQYGLGSTIMSFVIGIPLFIMFSYIIKKIDKRINKK